MKKNFKTVVLSCLVCICLFAGSALPVQAVGPGSDCPHKYFAIILDGPTGEYEYLESGHYQVWGEGYACLRCGYEYYTNTHLVFESDHEFGEPIVVLWENGTAEVRYYCAFNGCGWYFVYE